MAWLSEVFAHPRAETVAPLPSSARVSLPLATTPAISAAVRALCSSRLAPTIAEAIGEDAALCELRAVVTSAGVTAEDHHIHPAHEANGTAPRMLTAMIGLATPCDTSALLVWPKSHVPLYHAACAKLGAERVLTIAPGVHLTLARGGCALLESRLWRRGGAHANAAAPAVSLAVSFMPMKWLLVEPFAHLLPCLAGRLCLRTMPLALCEGDARAAPLVEASTAEASAAREDLALPDQATLRSRWKAAHATDVTLAPIATERSAAHVVAAAFCPVLEWAARGETAAVVNWLEGGGGGQHIRTHGGSEQWILLIAASHSACVPLITELTRRRACVSAADAHGRTALHHAAACSQDDVATRLAVLQLLKAGSNVELRDAAGMAPVDVAAKRGDERLVELLRGQRFRPVVVRQVLSAQDIACLAPLYDRLTPVHRTSRGHTTQYLHAGQAECRGPMHTPPSAAVVGRVVAAMRAADPRWSAEEGALSAELNVRVAELHRYMEGGCLMNHDHRDYGSVLSMSVLLSQPNDFCGGQFVTYDVPDDERRPMRETDGVLVHELRRGDGILFRSEDLHNVMPVTGGTRLSCVVELSAEAPLNVDRLK